MYEHLRSEMIAKLITKFPKEDVDLIMSVVDRVMMNYNVEQKSTAVQIYDSSTYDAIKMYLMCRKAEGLQDGSMDNLRYTLNRFADTVGKPLKEISTNDIRGYLFLYQQRENVKACTVDKIRQRINSFFNWCANEGIISYNPAARVAKIKAAKSDRRALTEEELEYCRNQCLTLRDKALLEVLYSTGARVSEVSRINIKDIDWNHGSVRVFGKNSEWYTVYLNARAIVSLKTYLKERKDSCPALFVTERSPSRRLDVYSLRNAIEKIGKRADLEIVLSPHVLRHTMATMALQHGTPLEIVQRMLNHKNPATTQIYAELNKLDVEAAHRRAVI